MGGLWSILTVLGPILIAVVVIWAIWRTRRETRPGDVARTEAATRDLRNDIDREDKQRDGEDTPR
ncbi:MAG TPA: hypothetical protein VIR65_02845 [Rhizorhapis sp.]